MKTGLDPITVLKFFAQSVATFAIPSISIYAFYQWIYDACPRWLKVLNGWLSALCAFQICYAVAIMVSDGPGTTEDCWFTKWVCFAPIYLIFFALPIACCETSTNENRN